MSSYWQTSGQACCSVQIGDSFSFYSVMQLSPAGPLYQKYLTVSFAFGLLCMSTVFLWSNCLSSGPYCLLHPHTLNIILTLWPLCLCLLFVFSHSSLSLLGATISKMRTLDCPLPPSVNPHFLPLLSLLLWIGWGR